MEKRKIKSNPTLGFTLILKQISTRDGDVARRKDDLVSSDF